MNYPLIIPNELIATSEQEELTWHLSICNYQQNMVLSTTLLHNGHSHLNNRCKGCWSCQTDFENLSQQTYNNQLNDATGRSTYQLGTNVVQVLCIDPKLLRIHCKVSHQGKNRRHLDHVLMLKKSAQLI
jgi:hypothetical protein